MNVQVTNPLTSSRFVCMCMSNWFMHLYVYALIPLMAVAIDQMGGSPLYLASAVLSFAVGMILPGPFCAHLMERRSRKGVFLKAMILLGFLPTIAFMYVNNPLWIVVIHAFQGLAFGVAQSALGTTLVNDVLPSRSRHRGGMFYAWAGRLGVPLGLLGGVLATIYLPIAEAWMWTLPFSFLSFFLVAQTTVPIKAPVKVSRMTFDRFFLPKTWPLVLSMFVAPWLIGHCIGMGLDWVKCLYLMAGTFVAFVLQMYLSRFIPQVLMVIFGYVCLLLASVLLGSETPICISAVYMLAALGMGVVSAQHLETWMLQADHCQRGTAQSTYMLSWQVVFAIGFGASSTMLCSSFIFDLALCVGSILFYVLWVSLKNSKRAA